MIDKNISIVTGTLNRKRLLPGLIKNTVDSDERLELVLVDGGSKDGTQKYIHDLNHPRIKLIEVGKRSSYPHFMNLGIKNSSHDYICQWNDDVFLVNNWDDVFKELDDSMVYIFAWKVDKFPKFKDKKWHLINSLKEDGCGEIVVNYGIYHKDVFRKIGLYNNEYRFYCADGDMAHRAWFFGFKVKDLYNIKVVSLKKVTKAPLENYNIDNDIELYKKQIEQYKNKILPDNLTYL
jgi:glycosyltransferase involved in cell wall biosynthesis